MLKRSLALAAFLLLLAVPAAGAATITPTRFDDPTAPAGYTCPADCSLRGALSAADPGDTVSLAAGTYAVTSTSMNIYGLVNITGAGARSTTISSAGNVGLIHVWPAGIAQISNLTLTSGEGFSAGALYNEGVAGLSGTSISGNAGQGGYGDVVGGAIHNAGTLTINRSTLAHNYGHPPGAENASGGAIYNTSIMTVVNSTFYDNYVQTSSGLATGGAVYGTETSQNNFYNVTFGSSNSAFANNAANSLGGQAYTESDAGWRIANTLFADSIGSAIYDTCSIALTDAITLGGNVDSSPGRCGADEPMDATSVDPGLGPFGNNGGQTDTQLISPTGPAAGLGLSGICAYTAVAVADTDQRGGKRISGANCDSGAVELNSLSDVALSGALGKVKFGSPVTFTLKITNNGPDPLLGATLGGANCAIGPLAVGASTSCAGSINWNGDSSISQTFTVSGDFIDPSGAGSLTLSALAPRLTSVSLRPPKITPTKSGATLGTKKIKGAAAIKYAGIDLASLSVPIQAPTGGNIVKGKCVKRKSGAKAKGKSCVLWRTLTTASVKNAKPSGTLYFTGRVKNKALKKGKYRLALTALSSDGGVGSPWYVAFSVK